MADNAKPQKVNIGFLGGPVLSARVAPDALTGLRQALEAGGFLVSDKGTLEFDIAAVRRAG